MSLYAFISLLYKQLLKYTLLKSFTVPSAFLTKFYKKFHTKILVSAVIVTKLSPKTLCFDAAMFHLSIEGYRKIPPYRSYYCCKSSSFIVNGIIQKSSHITAGVRHDVITPRKRRRRDADMLSAAEARRRQRTALLWNNCVSAKRGKWCRPKTSHTCSILCGGVKLARRAYKRLKGKKLLDTKQLSQEIADEWKVYLTS